MILSLIGSEEDPDFRPAWIHRLEAIEIAGLGIRQQYPACRKLTMYPRQYGAHRERYLADAGRGAASPGRSPMDQRTMSTHIFWISGRPQTSSRCPRPL